MWSKNSSILSHKLEYDAKSVYLLSPKSNLIMVYGGIGSLRLHEYNRIQIFDAFQGKTLKLLGETSFGESDITDLAIQTGLNDCRFWLIKNYTVYQYSILKVNENMKIEITSTIPMCETMRPQFIRITAGHMSIAFDNGCIHLWKLSPNDALATHGKMKDPTCKIEAHKSHFDYFDLSPDGFLAVSVCNREDEASLWNCNTGKLIMEVSSRICYKSGHRTPITSTLQTRFCRFGKNESQPDTLLLYSIHSPMEELELSKTSSFLVRWDCKAYKETRIADIGTCVPSALAVTIEGRYVGIGNKYGSVDIYISFSLMRLYHLEGCGTDNPVVDLTFLSTKIAEERGNDLELLSLDTNNSIRYHKVPSRQTISIVWPIVIAIALVALLFKLISELGL